MTTPLQLAAREPMATAPSIGPNHPATLCFHALTDAQLILVREHLDIAGLDRVTELVTQSGHHLGELYLLFIRQEKLIEEQRLEIIGLKRANAHLETTDTENKTRLAVAQRAKDSMLLDMRYMSDMASDLLERATSLDLVQPTPVSLERLGITGGVRFLESGA